MKNLFQQNEREPLLKRLTNVTPNLQNKWGSMNVHQMIVHLADPFRASLGDRPVPYYPSAFGKFPFNKFAALLMPWPKSAPTAPDFIQGLKGSSPAEFEQDKQALFLLIHRFAQHDNNHPFPLHPSFGKLTNKEWARVMWRHLDHHLRQFGM